MKNKICVSALLIILIVTMSSFSACDQVEYCTVTVEGFTVPNHVYEFRVVKGERFTLSQVFNTVSHAFMSEGMDLYALAYKDGKLYDESQPVESDLQLLAISGVSYNMAYATVKIESDRLKDICRQSGTNYDEANTFLYIGYVNEQQIQKLFDITVEDIQYRCVINETTICGNLEEIHQAISDYICAEDNADILCGDNVFCSPNLHHHMPHVTISLY